MRVRISEPKLLPQLIESLLRGDCAARPVDETTCEVVHGAASDEREARIELTFFLRAWVAQHANVRAELVACTAFDRCAAWRQIHAATLEGAGLLARIPRGRVLPQGYVLARRIRGWHPSAGPPGALRTPC